MSSYAEKRINCSINTWIRSPGIVMFVTLVGACWVHPLEGTPPSDLMPWYFFVPVCGVIFFNAQVGARTLVLAPAPTLALAVPCLEPTLGPERASAAHHARRGHLLPLRSTTRSAS